MKLEQWILLSYRKLFSCETEADAYHGDIMQVCTRRGLLNMFWKEQRQRELQLFTMVEVSSCVQEIGADC